MSIKRTLQRVKDRAYFFEIWIKFCFVLQEIGIRAVIENPSSPIHRSYLELYSPFRPTFRESDRTKFGDSFVKPTNFYAINFDMKEQFMMFDKEYCQKTIKSKTAKENSRKNVITNKRERSEITPRYADNFYKRFIQEQIKEVQ